MDAKEVLKKMNENYFSVAAIRRCRKDENYEVGDICRNSFDCFCDTVKYEQIVNRTKMVLKIPVFRIFR